MLSQPASRHTVSTYPYHACSYHSCFSVSIRFVAAIRPVPAPFLLCFCPVPALFFVPALLLPCSCSIPALFLLCSCPVPALLLPCSCPAPYSDEMQCRQCISFSPYAERHPFHRYRHLKHWFRSQGISAGFLFPGKSGKYTALLYRSKAVGHLPERE